MRKKKLSLYSLILTLSPPSRFLLWRNVLFSSPCLTVSAFLLPLFSLFPSNTCFHQSINPLFTSSNFSPTSLNTLPQIFYCSTYTIVLPYIFPAIPFSYTLPFLLYFLFSSTCHLTSTPNLLSKSSTNSFAFLKSSSFSHISLSTVNPFHHTKYFSTSLIFLLFKIFSIFHSSTPSTFTGFSSSFFCLFICFLYQTI